MIRRIVHSKIFFAIAAIVSLLTLTMAGVENYKAKTGTASQQAAILIAQPMTAAQVCNQLHGKNFVDKFKRVIWPTITDDGLCWINNRKYGVNVFTGDSQRADWLKVAANVGVVAKWEIGTAVVYPSVSSSTT